MFSRLPVAKLSIPRTWSPWARTARAMDEPMNPAMPVMRKRATDQYTYEIAGEDKLLTNSKAFNRRERRARRENHRVCAVIEQFREFAFGRGLRGGFLSIALRGLRRCGLNMERFADRVCSSRKHREIFSACCLTTCRLWCRP